jgi:hypothetical protein
MTEGTGATDPSHPFFFFVGWDSVAPLDETEVGR